jgi:hypothetical protein
MSKNARSANTVVLRDMPSSDKINRRNIVSDMPSVSFFRKYLISTQPLILDVFGL